MSGSLDRGGDDEAEAPAALLHARRVGLVGQSAAFLDLVRRLEVVRDVAISVLLVGQTGAGKSLVARCLHEQSEMRGRFVPVNCAHLTHERALVDLFGAARGAYTGCAQPRSGLIAEADGGTLFLDEVDALPLEVQGMLLTFLDDGTWRRVGEATLRKSAVRVVSATNREALPPDRLRADLVHRLSQFCIRVPPLEERRDDIALLARSAVARAASSLGITPIPLSEDATASLAKRAWPGNVRELECAVRGALLWARAAGSATILPCHLVVDPRGAGTPQTLQEAERAFRAHFVNRVLAECLGNRTEAARRLGIHRSSLHVILAQHQR